MAESTVFERRQTFTGLGGSNPSSSAIIFAPIRLASAGGWGHFLRFYDLHLHLLNWSLS